MQARPPRTAALISLLVALVVFIPHLAYPQGPPEVGLLREAVREIESNPRGSIPKLQAVSHQYPGTPVDAQARLSLAWAYAALIEWDQSAEIYRRVISDFPNTLYSYVSEVNLLDHRLLVERIPFADYLAGLDALIARAGGPNITSLRSGQRGSIRPVQGLTPNVQAQVLGSLYITAAGRLSRRPGKESSVRMRQESINIRVFVLSEFPELYGQSIPQSLRREILSMNGQLGMLAQAPRDTTQPSIRKTKPTGNTGLQPRIRAQIIDGGPLESQVDLKTIKLKLDGVNISSNQVEVMVKVARNPKHKVFQQVSLRYQPELSPGPHSVTLQAADLAGNTSVHSWGFTVVRGRGQDDDDERGWDRCDAEPDTD